MVAKEKKNTIENENIEPRNGEISNEKFDQKMLVVCKPEKY